MEWVEQSPEEPRRLGDAARERVRHYFNWDRVTSDYLALAREVHQDSPRKQPGSSPDILARRVVSWLEELAFDEAGAAIPSEVRARPELLSEQIAIQGLGPLLGARVQCGRLSVSSEIDHWLARQPDLNRRRLDLLREDLERVLAAFRRDDIEAIPLKGSAMLLDRPDEIGWRPMADLDLLVRHPNQQSVDLAYAHAGYCLPLSYSTGLSGLTWKHLHYECCEYAWPAVDEPGEHPDHPRDIESHPRVVEMMRGIRWDLTGWIANNLNDANGHPIPDERAMTLHLAVHASMSALDSRLRIVQIVDLLRQLERTGPDPVLAAVRKSGLARHARFVYPALALAARQADDARLSETVRQLEPYVSPEMADWIATASYYDLSWSTRMRHPVDEQPWRWATTLRERLWLGLQAVAPLPRDLSGRYRGEGMRAIAGWYPAYYRDRLRAWRGDLPQS
jgi:hypothetical protein